MTNESPNRSETAAGTAGGAIDTTISSTIPSTISSTGALLRDATPPPESIERQDRAPAAGPDDAANVAAEPPTAAAVRPAAPLPRQDPGRGKPPATGGLPPGRVPPGQAPAGQESPGQEPPGQELPPDYSRLLMPDGYDAGDTLAREAMALFGAHRLAPDVAQKLIDLAARRDKAVAQSSTRAYAEAVQTWQSALRADLRTSTEFTGAEHGGDRLKELQTLTAKAIAAYGGEDAAAITQHLKTYGLGDFGPFARFMARAGRSVREDNLPRSNTGGSETRNAQSLYANSNMNE